MTTDSITVQLDYTEREYVSAVRLYYNHYYHAKTYLAASVLTILMGIAFWQYTQARPVFLGVAFFSVLVSIPIGYYVIFPLTAYRRNQRLHQLYWMTFSESHIEVKSQDTTSQLKWQFYQTMWENEQFFFLFADQRPTIIPKRTFENQAQLSRFRELVQAKLA